MAHTVAGRTGVLSEAQQRVTSERADGRCQQRERLWVGCGSTQGSGRSGSGADDTKHWAWCWRRESCTVCWTKYTHGGESRRRQARESARRTPGV